MVQQYIRRRLEDPIQRLVKKFPIVTILGVRQAGKTTLLRQMFPTYAYVNLESPDVRSRVIADPRRFLNQYKNTPVIIDEIQRVPEIASYLQEYADTVFSSGQVLLTGSQQLNVSQTISQSLVGRSAILHLFPFSLEELPKKMHLSTVEDIIIKGFYPAIFDRNLNPLDWYPSYYQTYLERDVRQLLEVGNIEKFQKFITLLAGRAGQLLSLNSLGIEAGITQPTARKWLSVLRASQVVFVLPPFYQNIHKRIIKSPKVYFIDTGLLCYLLGILSAEDLAVHPLRGSIFENFVIGEFYKYAGYAPKPPKYYFFRDKSGHEVDLIIQQSNRFDLIEIKFTYTIQNEYFRHLSYFSKYLNVASQSVCYAGDQNLPQVLGWKDLARISVLPLFNNP